MFRKCVSKLSLSTHSSLNSFPETLEERPSNPSPTAGSPKTSRKPLNRTDETSL